MDIRYIVHQAEADTRLTFHDLLPLPRLVLVESNIYLPQDRYFTCDNGLKNGDSHLMSLLFGADTV